VVTILADVLQTELITPKAEEGAALGAIWQWWGLRTQFEAAFRYCHRIASSTATNPVYEAAFKRYSLLYDALKSRSLTEHHRQKQNPPAVYGVIMEDELRGGDAMP